ncbi:MAG: hypothetical protein ACRELY_11125 [Polyangiaceae bacterium]
MRLVLVATLGFVFACAPPVSAVGTGRFVSDDAIANVKVCETRGDEVLASFGEPTARGRDNDFTTLQWISMVAARDATHAAMASQVIQVWVDKSGLVASIVVNPATAPTTPSACSAASTKSAAKKKDNSKASKTK